MDIIYATDESFNELINDDYVLVDFYADWCGPCKMLGPVLESIKNQIKIVKVNVDECEKTSKQFGVMSIPTIILFKEKEEISKKIGYMSSEELTSWINQNR